VDEPHAPRDRRMVALHIAAGVMALVVAWSMAVPFGADVLILALIPWNLAPLALWWSWSQSLLQRDRSGRVLVAGALVAAAAVFYPLMVDAVRSDALGPLAYVFLPFWLLVGVVVLLALGALAERFVEWSARPPSQRR
jgi:hypothetical protein